MKIVNLDDKRNAVKIIVSGQEFEIARLTLKASGMIAEWRQISIESYSKIQEFLSSLDTYIDPKKDEKKNADTLKKMVSEFDKSKDKLQKRVADLQEAAIKKVLEDNGFAYDNTFWTEVVDNDAPANFLTAIIEKNKPEDDQKKRMTTR